MREITVKMISSNECRRCHNVENRLLNIGKKIKEKIFVEKINFNLSDAIDLAIKYGLDDIPSFVILGKGFNGDLFTDSEIIKLIKGDKNGL